MGKRYPLKRGWFNRCDRAFSGPPPAHPLRRGRVAALVLLLAVLMAAAGCRLPARSWRWEVRGAEQTWLEGLGEGRACGLSVRVWVADRTMWPFPLPGSRRLFFGDDDLDPLILVDSRREDDAPFAPARAVLRAPDGGATRRPEAADPRCPAAAPAGGRIACTLAIAAPRGAENLAFDLTDVLACDDTALVFRLAHHASWTWRRVGPGVPGL